MSTPTEERPVAPPPAPSPPRHHVPGEIGIWAFILMDLAVFTSFFGAYLHDRGGAADLFAASQAKLSQDFGAVNTLILLTSSLLVVVGVRGLRSGQRRVAERALWGAVACGVAFCVVKVFEWGGKFADDIGPGTDAFWGWYFGLTGIHLLHLLIGLGVLGYLLRKARKPALGDDDVSGVETGASFWHMVDLLWVVLFPLLYLAH